MASKPVYKQGELSATRARLGTMSENEAKRMMGVLGGEVGDESETQPEKTAKSKRGGKKGTPLRRVETVDLEDESGSKINTSGSSANEEVSYFERIKMDKLAAGSDFKVKTKIQAFCSHFAFFGKSPDYVSYNFVINYIDGYYASLEKLVNQVRFVFPRNNSERSQKFRKNYPFSFSVLETLRYWKIEKIAASMARIQIHPRIALIRDFEEIVAEFYKPLFILELLDPDVHIRKALEDLKEMLQDDLNSPLKGIDTINNIVFLYEDVDKDIRYRLFPILLKLLSNVCYSYEDFFTKCRKKILDFLRMKDEDRIEPVFAVSKSNNDEVPDDRKEELDPDVMEELGIPQEEAETPEEEEEEKSAVAMTDLPKAVQKGLEMIETLFPDSGWKRANYFPDMYTYFSKTISLKKNADLIAPENPMIQALILLQILEELFYGFRSIKFTEAEFDLEEFLNIIDSWHKLIETAFERTYLPRLAEFQKLFDNVFENKTKSYSMKIREELNWLTRLYLFPSIPVESFSPPPFKKNDINAVFPKVRSLRASFVYIAGEIEKALQSGGPAVDAHCSAIANPWEEYVFQVPNPLSKRLDLLLGIKSRNNVSLIYFTLSVLTVLDYLLNNQNSWAYKTNTNKIFRSLDEDGLKPAPLPDIKIDADGIFKKSLEHLKAKNASNK